MKIKPCRAAWAVVQVAIALFVIAWSVDASEWRRMP